MSILNTPGRTSPTPLKPQTCFDLLVFRSDFLIQHQSFSSPEERLAGAFDLLCAEEPERIDRDIDVELIRRHHHEGLRRGAPADAVFNTLAKLCRRWNVRLYASNRVAAVQPPAVLFSTITRYSPVDITTEHFTTQQERRESLLERAFNLSSLNPSAATYREHSDVDLTVLIAAAIAPADVILTEAIWDDAEHCYRPASLHEALDHDRKAQL